MRAQLLPGAHWSQKNGSAQTKLYRGSSPIRNGSDANETLLCNTRNHLGVLHVNKTLCTGPALVGAPREDHLGVLHVKRRVGASDRLASAVIKFCWTCARKEDVRLPGQGNSHGARPVY